MSGSDSAKELVEFLRSLDARLSVLESRPPSRTPSLTSIKYPSPYLESSEKLLTADGLQTITTVPVCSVCHKALAGDYYSCSHCSRMLCQECAIIHNNRAHCEDCIREFHVDLSRRDYFVLIAFANGLKDFGKISEAISAAKEDVGDSATVLLSSNLVTIEKRCLGLLHGYKLTDLGLLAVQVYRRIYGKDEDTALVGRNLRNMLFSEK